MIKDLLRETEGRMQKSLNSMEDDFKTIRTGRASPALVERVLVEYYGTPTLLNQLSVISAPEPQLLVIRPYDPSSITAIQKGIQHRKPANLPRCKEVAMLHHHNIPVSRDLCKEILALYHREERKIDNTLRILSQNAIHQDSLTGKRFGNDGNMGRLVILKRINDSSDPVPFVLIENGAGQICSPVRFTAHVSDNNSEDYICMGLLFLQIIHPCTKTTRVIGDPPIRTGRLGTAVCLRRIEGPDNDGESLPVRLANHLR